MSSIGTGYDFSVTTYSPDGRIFQVEYADKAVEKSGTVIGVCCKDGVVLGVEKLIEFKMMEKGSNSRISTVARHSGMALAGWQPDTRLLVSKARKEANDYKSFYGASIPGHLLCDRLSSHMHMHTMYGYLRPYGISALLATYDPQNGPTLYNLTPSGKSWGYYACAIGKGQQAAKNELEKLDFKTITCKEAVKEIAKILYGVHDQVKDKEFELEMSWVSEESKHQHVRIPQELLDEAIQYAKDSLKEEDEESDEEIEDQ